MTPLPIQIALVADPGTVDVDDLNRVAAALTKQITRDFAPIWQKTGQVHAFKKGKVPLGYWPIAVQRDIDYDAAGVHLDFYGQPYGLIDWTGDERRDALTISHEVLEIMADPQGNFLCTAAAPVGSGLPGRVRYLVEVCDPCEADEYAYEIDGVPVSDFLMPRYYQTIARAGETFSFTGAIKKPRSLLPGGYVSFAVGTTWHQVTWFGGAKPKLVTLSPDTEARIRAGASIRSVIDTVTKPPAATTKAKRA